MTERDEAEEAKFIIDLVLIVAADGTRKMMAVGLGWHTDLVPADGAFRAMKEAIYKNAPAGYFDTEIRYGLEMQLIHAFNLKHRQNKAGQPYPMSEDDFSRLFAKGGTEDGANGDAAQGPDDHP